MKFLKQLPIVGSVFFVLISIYISCDKNGTKVEIKHLKTAIEYLDIDDSINWIVILPELGCTGCIREAEMFMKENIENKEIMFVLTKISSLKILQQKININIHDYQNIYIDRENVFNIPTDNTIYPCIVKLKNCTIVSYEFQSPDNSMAFLKLKNHILAQ